MAGEEGPCWLRLKGLPLLLLLALLFCWAGVVRGDFASDQAECADSLVGLSTCLTYVEGSSKSPTPDCCSGLKQVIGKTPKCLCILIKDRNDPQLGFKIDASRAMSLPSSCSVPVNITQCIDLLKLAPNSKDAEIFKQFSNTTKPGSAAEKTAPSNSNSSSSPASSGGGPASKAKDSSNGVGLNHPFGRCRWAGVEVVGGLWASCLLVLSLLIMGG